MCVTHSEPPSHAPPHPIPQGVLSFTHITHLNDRHKHFLVLLLLRQQMNQ